MTADTNQCNQPNLVTARSGAACERRSGRHNNTAHTANRAASSPRQFDTSALNGYNDPIIPTGGEPMRYNRSCSFGVRSASCDR